MTHILPRKRLLGVLLALYLGLFLTTASRAQSGTITQLYSFPCPNTISGVCSGGYSPNALIQAADGKVYGTAVAGGTVANGKQASGTVWSLDVGLPAPSPAAAAFSPAIGAVGSTVVISRQQLRWYNRGELQRSQRVVPGAECPLHQRNRAGRGDHGADRHHERRRYNSDQEQLHRAVANCPSFARGPGDGHTFPA